MPSVRWIKSATTAIALFVVLGVAGQSWAQTDDDRTAPQRPALERPYSTSKQVAASLDLDPAEIHSPLIPTVEMLSDTANYPERFVGFYDLLKIHAARFGVDDNFTMRFINRDSGEILERYVLTEEREKFLETGKADWPKIDEERRRIMKRKLDDYERRGYRRRGLSVTWGRLNQVFEARERDEPYLSYEIRLAKMHGLSALSTELGTVETFNQDWLVSRAGARGRYQFMPDLLRRFGIHRYRLKTTSGRTVRVYEERHPLITMEHAFEIMRAYANAVGHEIPGLSAYNTGVGNIFNLARIYLMRERPNLDEATVFDAYSWAVTDGFSEVSRQTTFRRQSRAYLPSVLGAYRAVEHMPVHEERTMMAELLSLRRGQRINLKDLLDRLENEELDWTPWNDGSIYESFLSFNQHITLPEAGPDGKMPNNGNLILANPSSSLELRIFLPLGASDILEEEGLKLFDAEKTRYFNEFTFQDPAKTGEKSLLDWEYDSLVRDIGGFGFTLENRDRLGTLAEQMQRLADERPTPYRKSQALIADMHRRLWSHGPWVKLEKAVEQTRSVNEAELRQGLPPTPAN
jgi:hypothetical protein